MGQSVGMKMKNHDHYYRSVKGIDKIDVYRVLELFDVTCPVAQHVVKKAMAAGKRGHKSDVTDWENIRDSALRKLEMMKEDLDASGDIYFEHSDRGGQCSGCGFPSGNHALLCPKASQ